MIPFLTLIFLFILHNIHIIDWVLGLVFVIQVADTVIQRVVGEEASSGKQVCQLTAYYPVDKSCPITLTLFLLTAFELNLEQL